MANALEKWLNHEFSFDLMADDGYKQFQEEACNEQKLSVLSLG